MSKLKTKSIDMEDRIRHAKWKEFMHQPSKSILDSLYKKLHGPNSKPPTSKDDLITAIDNKLGNQMLTNHIYASLDKGMPPDKILNDFIQGQAE